MLAPNSIRSPKMKLEKIETITRQSDSTLKASTNKIIKKKLVVQEKISDKKILTRPFSKLNLKVFFEKLIFNY
jgi:hypothetical protein